MMETREGRPACHMQHSLNHCIKVLLYSTEPRLPGESFLWILHVRWTINMKYKLVEETNIQTCCDARRGKDTETWIMFYRQLQCLAVSDKTTTSQSQTTTVPAVTLSISEDFIQSIKMQFEQLIKNRGRNATESDQMHQTKWTLQCITVFFFFTF